MYTMKGACEATGMSYETLKFYCNQGLLPNVKRDAHNHRIFDNHDIGWLKSLTCLRNFGSLLSKHPSTTSTGSRDSMTMCSQGARPTSAIFSRMKRMQNLQKRALHMGDSIRK